MNPLKLTLTAAAAILVIGAGACSTAPKSEADKGALTYDARGALESFKGADPSLQGLLDRSNGYAIFPDIGKAGFIAGGAYGRGEVYENGKFIGYTDVTKGSLGLQAGAQTFSELVVFLTPAQMDTFKKGKFSLTADVSAIAIKSGAAAAADYSKGVVVFTHTKGGLMAEASVGGQGFSYVPASTRTATHPEAAK